MISKSLQILARKSSQLLQNKSCITTGTRAFGSGTKFVDFDYTDAFNLEELLTEEEKMIRDSARQYAQDKLMGRIQKAYNKEEFDIEIMKEMGQQGFLGCTLSDYNLPGVSSVSYGLINREVERVDSGYRSAMSV